MSPIAKTDKIKDLENQIKKLEKERDQSEARAEREHQKRMLCLRKLLVDELKSV
jgi:hypothetical protein